MKTFLLAVRSIGVFVGHFAIVMVLIYLTTRPIYVVTDPPKVTAPAKEPAQEPAPRSGAARTLPFVPKAEKVGVILPLPPIEAVEGIKLPLPPLPDKK